MVAGFRGVGGAGLSETVADILAAHRSGASTPEQTLRRCYERIRAQNDPGIFITLRDEEDAVAEARALGNPDLPLYGVPVAVKDNIDVKGLPTTAACPDFSYVADKDATAVARLRAAGAIVVGKTNLDQFATGLVGTRTPYPIPRNALRDDYIPGGSSSGSAVAVAAGIVPLALGTDTAGSGRVPAMLNNIIGLKPSLGLVSTCGVVPACRTIDCVSVFALTTDDAWAALDVMAGHDPLDAYSRRREAGAMSAMPPHLKLGVPRPGSRIFFGDETAAADYETALQRLAHLGATLVEIDIEPFYETARLLYEGPWVAERYAVARSLIASSPESLHPVTRAITISGQRPTAVDTFTAFYRLEELRRVAERTFRDIDALALPTAPTVYTVEQVLNDPIQLNSRLGTYTNFVNLLDLCGLAIPSALHPDKRPFGITLLAPGGRDAFLASVGRVFHADTALPLGATGAAQKPARDLPPVVADGEIAIAVVGAHLSGMPLNAELTGLGGRFLEKAETAQDYRLFALAGTTPPKPGLLRVAAGQGAAIAVEIWAMPAAGFGTFVAAIPGPLSIGTLTLADGRGVKGFLVEAEAVKGAQDISSFGGWRAFVIRAAS
jgi:allophanate hydrolase